MTRRHNLGPQEWSRYQANDRKKNKSLDRCHFTASAIAATTTTDGFDDDDDDDDDNNNNNSNNNNNIHLLCAHRHSGSSHDTY